MSRTKNSDGHDGTSSSTFKIGAVCLAFLILGYEVSLFVHRAAVLRITSLRDTPDTVFVIDESLARRLLAEEYSVRGRPADDGGGYRSDGCGALPDGGGYRSDDFEALPDGGGGSGDGGGTDGNGNGIHSGNGIQGGGGNSAGNKLIIRREAGHSKAVQAVRDSHRKVESFRFDPNTAGLEELQRLGFTEKQAQSIINYRSKGGRFRRKEDFAKSFVVADSVYRRLEPYIDIPKIDINRADSAAFDSLPGIGGWFASKMVAYREELGGYSYKEQLLDIYHFDQDKFDGLKDLVSCSGPRRPFRLWSLPADSLRLHPYIRSWQTARSIVLFRGNSPREDWTVDALEAAGILPAEDAARLRRCVIAAP